MSDFQTYVTERRHRAASAMAELSGNTSACAMGRAGQSFPAYKYHEGATAALGALSRKLRREPDADPAGLVNSVLPEWQSPGGEGRDWEAYTAGGREALESAADHIRRGMP
ncbi:hypothetical protein [Corynebacterium comes]|uniref:Uncharacterized protein n=1 Tax=Corynebacterium comes TaxID=2675218 RepID=A0A6B8VVY3_9CORY|nr:hypothetical protein [Corynebacterium comes]QGU03837.1 hypothetical protein CETAM_02785 [Corynebacterium comes]